MENMNMMMRRRATMFAISTGTDRREWCHCCIQRGGGGGGGGGGGALGFPQVESPRISQIIH